ncbi:MAG: tryptophan synthase subunit alpha [Euryarchaeota archaeon]|nr:tryptophan synthase subunit alpha [Euryarchaeota archaeon]
MLKTSRIEAKFEELKQKNEGALIGYLTLGDPGIATSEKLIKCLVESVDILELGIPFTDPIADGPTIQAAIDRALRAGMNTDIAFETVRKLRRGGIKTPFVFMTYYNIVLQYGEERFVKRCGEAGVDGLIVCDLPVEESKSLLEHCEKHGTDFIFLIAPTTNEERLKKILPSASGFIYLVSLLGTTGAREKLQKAAIEKTKWALRYTQKKLPLAVGFGISKKEHVRGIISAGAQGVVVGSAFVSLIAEKKGEACEELRKLARELKEGTKI